MSSSQSVRETPQQMALRWSATLIADEMVEVAYSLMLTAANQAALYDDGREKACDAAVEAIARCRR